MLTGWLLLAVVRPTLEYGSEVWEADKTQAAALESVMLGGAKHILGCSSSGDMWLDTLQRRREENKLKWWYKLAALPGNIGIRRSSLTRNGILSHGEGGRRSVGVRSLMISFRH